MTLQHSSISAKVNNLIAETPGGHSSSVRARQIDHRSPEKVSPPAFCFHQENHWVQHNPFRGQRASPQLPWSASCSSVGAQRPERSPLFFSKHGFSTALADLSWPNTHIHTHTHWTVLNHFCHWRNCSFDWSLCEPLIAWLHSCIVSKLFPMMTPLLHYFRPPRSAKSLPGALESLQLRFPYIAVVLMFKPDCIFNYGIINTFSSHI